MSSLSEHIKTYDFKDVKFFDFNGIYASHISQLADEIDDLISTIDLANTSFVGIESRGFILASILADRHHCGLVLARKKGKLPGETEKYTYKLEYGEDTLEIQKEYINNETNYIIVDDLLATGGTIKAVISLIEKLGGKVNDIITIGEIEDLKGRELLSKYNVVSLFKLQEIK